MCGIFGALNSELSNEQLMEAGKSLQHRGPDEVGIYRDEHVALGSQRLKIVDIENGKQPFFSEDKKISLVFNGEIYNYLILKKSLQGKGHSFRSNSEGEVLVHLYQEYKSDMFVHINGQFAIALYDREIQRLYLARDSVGICPAYFTFCNNVLYFASEIKALACMNKRKLILKPQALYEQFTYWTTLDERSIFEDVYQVPVGSYVEFEGEEKYSIQRYYKLLDNNQLYSFHNIDEVKSAIREGLKNSISKRIMCSTGIKWGMYLSGGLDSTIILKLLESMGIEGFPIYSLTFNKRGIDESAYQKLACANYLKYQNVVEIDNDKLINNIHKTLEHCEAPLYKLGAVPMYILSQNVRRDGVKFVLSGEGADEIFYGYDIYKEILIRKYLSKSINSRIRLADIKYVIPPQDRNNNYMLKGYEQYYLTSVKNTGDALFCIRPRIQASSIIYDYFNEEARIKIEKENLDAIIKGHYTSYNQLGMLRQCQHVEMDNLLAGYLLSIQGDRVLMANSVEGRYPFLDKDIIAVAYSIPEYLKLHGYNEKYILKETFRDILPAQILRRQKFQYSTPGAELIRNKFEFFEEYLTVTACEECGIFDYKMVRDLVNTKKLTITMDMLLVFIATTHMFHKIYEKWVK